MVSKACGAAVLFAGVCKFEKSVLIDVITPDLRDDPAAGKHQHAMTQLHQFVRL